MHPGRSWVFVLLILTGSFAISSCDVLSAEDANEPLEFEGFVEYVTTYEAIDERFPVEDMIRQMGVRSTLYYKSGKIRIDYKDADTQWSIYEPTNNLEYTLLRDENRLLYSDCGVPAKDVLEVGVEASKTKILDRQISVLTAKLEGGDTFVISFAPSLSVNPERFANYEVLPFWKIATGIYLRWETQRPFVVITKTATSIHEEPIPDSLFDLPDLPRISVSEFLEQLEAGPQ